MNNKHKLDKYLYLLDKALGGVSVSEKAEIITEIKSHILSALEHDNSVSIESILGSIGEPEQVASKYLLERGLKPNKAPFHPIFKWLIVGFLGTILVLALLCALLIWKLSPVFNFSDNVGNIEMLNGAVKIHFNTKNDDETSIQYTPPSKILADYKIMDPAQTQAINFNFTTATLIFSTTEESKLIWNCKNTGKDGNINIVESNHIINFDLKKLSNANCLIQLPRVPKTFINGIDGNISIDKPVNDTSIIMNNGVLKFEPSESIRYYYDIQVKNGTIDKFSSTKIKDAAVSIMARIENGKVINN